MEQQQRNLTKFKSLLKHGKQQQYQLKEENENYLQQPNEKRRKIKVVFPPLYKELIMMKEFYIYYIYSLVK